MTDLPRLKLKKNEDRRLRSGHLWVFSNEVDTAETPLKGITAGSLGLIESSKGESMGIAYLNPDSLICARMLSRDARTSIDGGYFKRRIEQALQLRERLYGRPFYRLIYGESDGLPGLIVDRFGDTLAVQAATAGMEALLEPILDALQAALAPRAIVIKNTSSLRALEGLANYVKVLGGELSDQIEIEENGARFRIDPVEGQKTGWFFDHRDSRATVAKLAKNCRVLDLFSYSGAWGVQAALGGAAQVDCVDSSEPALALARENADLNGVGANLHTHKSDVIEFLRLAREQRRRYDLVIVDPPAFIKRRKDVSAGIDGYRRLNQAALQVLAPGGILVSASCSFHLQRDTLHDLLRASARHLERHLVYFARGGQAGDHPVHPAIPETDYLKTFFCSVGTAL